MEYTKGKLTIRKSDQYVIIIADEKEHDLLKIHMPTWSTDKKDQAELENHPSNLEAKANAAHIVECWNTHDKLVATLVHIKVLLQNSHGKHIESTNCVCFDCVRDGIAKKVDHILQSEIN